MERIVYRELRSTPKVWGVMALCAAFVAAAGGTVLYIEHYGHIATGMNNQVVWGLPHVFAIFLIVAASGALNVSSIGSVFGKMAYKPVARLANVLAVSLLMGGLAVLVLDLGRPDRLIMAMYTYNFTSIFAWNILLYTGFIGVVAVYLYTLMARGVDPRALKMASLLAFVWRLALTTGTGSIFGWLVARTAYDSAIMAPMFIAMSFSFGMAMFMLVMILTTSITDRVYSPELRTRQARLLGVFVAAVLYFVIVHHLSNIYLAKKTAYESWILLGGGIYTLIFWVGQVLIGSLLPMILLFHPKIDVRKGYVLLAALLVVIGGFAQLYVIVIGGQAFPLEIFPGFEVSSSFNDGVVSSYTPTWLELSLGLGGVALALMIAGLAMKFLRIVPENLSDDNVDPALLVE